MKIYIVSLLDRATIITPKYQDTQNTKDTNITHNKHNKTKARFSHLLRHPASKQRGPIPSSVLNKSVTYLLT